MRTAEMRPRYLGVACAVAVLGLVLTYWKSATGDDVTSSTSRSVATPRTRDESPRPGLSDVPRMRWKGGRPEKRDAAGTPPRTASGSADRSVHGDAARPNRKLPTTLADSRPAPWSAPGQCVGAEAWGDRVSYFANFVQPNALTHRARADQKPAVKVRAYPSVSQAAVADVHKAVGDAELLAVHFKTDLVPPDIYVHASVEELRDHACVAASAQSYYDGAIHVAALEQSDELIKCVLHEYAHHILSELGVRRPVWLQEGFAQRFAGETTGNRPSSREAMDQVTMAEPLSTASTEEEVAAFYEQASDMLEFLNQLSSLAGKRGYAPLIEELTQGLASGVTDAEELFVWATTERGRNIVTGDALAFWERYLDAGGFDSETLAAIEEERNARRRQEPH